YGQFRFALNRSPGLLSLHPVHAFLIQAVLKRNQTPLLVPLCKKQRIFSCHFVICDLSHWFLSLSLSFFHFILVFGGFPCLRRSSIFCGLPISQQRQNIPWMI